MTEFQYAPGDALRLLLVGLFCVFAIWWFWMGARGAWIIARRFVRGRPASTVAVLAISLGWNVGFGIAIVFICLGAFTLLAANNMALEGGEGGT